MSQRYYSVAEIAERIGISPRGVRMIASRKGIEPADTIGGTNLFFRADLPKFGEPRGKKKKNAKSAKAS